MEQIKRKQSIKTSFVFYLFFCIFCAFFLSLLISAMCQFLQKQLYTKYSIEYETARNHLVFDMPDQHSKSGILNYYTLDLDTLFTPLEAMIYETLGILSIVCYPVCFSLCIIITSILFYRRQLQKPLELLSFAADNISNENLDFQITYDKQNELGALCRSFEKMRIALKNSYWELWRQMEERKRLNTAFAHDLRTPLTVLKGQSGLLIKYAPEMSENKIIETAKTMERHILRLENYVSTMYDLQRLEDLEIQKQTIDTGELTAQLKAAGAFICDSSCNAVCKKIQFLLQENETSRKNIAIDVSVLMQVYENLLANALRYTTDTITVSIERNMDFLCIRVSDNGEGFPAKDLANAVKPFYRSSGRTDHEHFGMGLYICNILCEKHGGYLKIENKDGACVTAAFRITD